MKDYSRISPKIDEFKVYYDEDHWQLLKNLRRNARRVMYVLSKHNISTVLHGSVARGDVNKDSDVDMAVLDFISPSIIETILDLSNVNINYRTIIQATPNSTPKLYYHLHGNVILAVPLGKLSRLEREFYKFGGELDLNGLILNRRVPGVNKNLRLVLPTEYGHIEKSIIGREEEVARTLNVSMDIIRERIRMLTRRESIGRTGVFIKRVLNHNESVNDVIKELMKKSPAFRRKVDL